MIKRFIARHDDVRRESFAGALSRGSAQAEPAGRIVDQALDSPGERAGVIRRHKESGRVVFDDLRNSTDTAGDTRAGKTHRFKYAQAKALSIGGEQTQVSGLQVIFDVIDPLAHEHPPVKSQAANIAGELSKAAARQDDEFESVAGADAAGGFEQQIYALERAEVGGMKHHDFVVEAELAAHRLPRTPRRTRFKEIVDYLHRPFKTERPFRFLLQK